MTRSRPEVLTGRVEPGPVLVTETQRIPWPALGEACVGAHVTVVFPARRVRDPLDADEAQLWADAVAVLDECLPPDVRGGCPDEELRVACAAARAGTGVFWKLVADAAGWDDAPPEDDRELWTGAAMAIVSVAVDSIDPDLVCAFDRIELNDWLAMVIELVRCGAGTEVDPDSLLALAARCLAVDSAAADRRAAPAIRAAFAAVIPIWEALGAVDASGALTALGAWGIPIALARAWGGKLEGE